MLLVTAIYTYHEHLITYIMCVFYVCIPKEKFLKPRLFLYPMIINGKKNFGDVCDNETKNHGIFLQVSRHFLRY